MTTIHRPVPSVPTPSPVPGAQPPPLPAPLPRTLVITTTPAELRPQDQTQHGSHQHATEPVVKVEMPAGTPHPSPRTGPNGEKAVTNTRPVSPKEIAFVGTAFVDICAMLANIGNADRFAKAAEGLDKHCQQACGRNFNTGLASGVLKQAIDLQKSLMNSSGSEKAIIAAVGAVLIVSECIPGLNVGVNYALGLVGATAAAEEIGNSLQRIGKGDSFAAGQHAGKATINALLAESSLKHSKLLLPLLEKLEGVKVSTLVASTWRQLAQTASKIELPTLADTAAVLKLGLEHVLSHVKPRPITTVSKATVESAHLNGHHSGGHSQEHGHHSQDEHDTSHGPTPLPGTVIGPTRSANQASRPRPGSHHG